MKCTTRLLWCYDHLPSLDYGGLFGHDNDSGIVFFCCILFAYLAALIAFLVHLMFQNCSFWPPIERVSTNGVALLTTYVAT